MSEEQIPTDILRLFREDLDSSDRVDAFRRAAEQIKNEVDSLATPENIEAINQNFDLTFVFNSHGNAIDAGQSIAVIHEPFITFVENAGDDDLPKNSFFETSVNNAFNQLFNNQPAIKPPFQLTPENSWHYWRDRGLFANGSIVAPVDIRHYSRRLLDALMGSDYDQGYLNSSIPPHEMQTKSFDEMVEQQVQKGELIMLSNAVRELTSTKQILETMLYTLDPKGENSVFSDEVADKLRALAQKRRDHADKLKAYVIYGTAHHAIAHVFKGLGIEANREYPGKVDLPGSFKFIGQIKDQFFSSHQFGITDEQKTKYAKEHIIESILWAPIDRPADYGVILEDDRVIRDLFWRMGRIARREELLQRAQEIYEQFKADPNTAVNLLLEQGIRLRQPDRAN